MVAGGVQEHGFHESSLSDGLTVLQFEPTPACAPSDLASELRTCTQSGTLHVVAKVVPVREFRTRLSELLGDVADRRDHVLVTRNGKPAAALVPIDEYEALEETAEILSDSATLSAIETGLADLARGDTVTLNDLRQELAQRRAAR
jgi:prevent-host-death family protein